MMAGKLFRGVYTAIITPFKRDESVDYDALAKLIELQILGGVQGIVVCGTTGESPTLNPQEHNEVIEFVISKVGKRVSVIAGTGSNSTREAIDLSIHAEHAGADALLLVNPYYNKPSQEGLYRHFKSIANSVKIPIILYNIKGRCGVNLETLTLMRLISDCPNIVAVKEASGDMNQIKEVISKKPDYFSVLSGDDSLTLDVIKAGGDGVICTSSNVVPKEWAQMVEFAFAGKITEAEKINAYLTPIFKVAFIETNPIPIKGMVSMMGLCEEVYRLPICELRPENKKVVEAVMKEKGLMK